MRKFILLLAAGAFAASALAGPGSKKSFHEGKKHWVINVGLFQGQGDLKDNGVDTGFTGSADYCFGGNENSTWYAGLGGFFGDGDGDLKFRAYGLHVGALIGFGKPGEDNPWSLDLRAGWYRTRVEDTVEVKALGSTEDVDDEEDGFGGSIAVVYQSKTGPRFSLGWFMVPEIGDSKLNGYFFTIGFPIGGK